MILNHSLIERELVKGSPIRGCMARQGKASRGKVRWLGLRINHGELSRGSTSKIIAENLPDIDFKLFDSISSELDTLAIIRLKLEYNDYAREKLASNPMINTLTTSGKIRLVRQRLGLTRPPRK